MQDPEDTPAPEEDAHSVFVSGWDRHNQPTRIVTFGHYYPQSKIGAAKTVIRETNTRGYRTDSEADAFQPDAAKIRDHVAWTRLINALGEERQWPLKRLGETLDPMLASDIALAAVPPHRAYQAFWPVRTLAQRLAASQGRIDATPCLVRHTTIRRIIFGGPSTRALHRETIQVEETHLIQGRRVLLLDDIAKSGASLIACREMLLEAGADAVQAVALGRVIFDRDQF